MPIFFVFMLVVVHMGHTFIYSFTHSFISHASLAPSIWATFDTAAQ